MGIASDTYAKLIRDQYSDWLTRFYPHQKTLMQHATDGTLMNQQLNRVGDSAGQSLRAAQFGMENQMGRYGIDQKQNPHDNGLNLRSALATAGAKNGIRESEADRRMNILTGGSASLKEMMNIGGK